VRGVDEGSAGVACEKGTRGGKREDACTDTYAFQRTELVEFAPELGLGDLKILL
jgi:hypothetical protein